MRLTNPGVISLALFFFTLIFTLYLLLKTRRNIFILLLRLFVLVILFIIIFQPTILFFERKDKPRAAILIDESASMKFSGRVNSAKKFISRNYSALSKNFILEAFGFSKTVYPLDKIPQTLNTEGAATDISGALLKVTALNPYDAVFLVSDGINNSGVSPVNIAKTPGIPIFTIIPDEKDSPRDISITEVKSGDFVFKNIPAEIEVNFNASGFTSQEITVYLKKGKEVISTKKKIIDSTNQEVAFTFTSSKLGQEIYTVEIPSLPEETVVDNNKKDITIETVREKVRILYICGQPSYEYYFLRHFIKSNPSIELVSFVILRNPENVAVVPEEQLSLIPFPAREIFLTELYEYDIVILENFAYARFYITPDYLASVSRFVREKGGSLLMMGGDTGLGRGGYSGTPIEEILPVKLDRPSEPVEEGYFKPRVVDISHPVAALAETREETLKLWQSQPELEGRQRILARPQASIIADDPSLKIEGENAVIIACREIGKGRTMVIGTNTTWRWQMGGGQYSKFWENTLYWLSGGETTKRLHLSIKQQQYKPDEEIEIKVIVTGKQFKNLIPKITITDPMSKTVYLEKIRPLQDNWSCRFTPRLDGKYVIKAWIEKKGELLARDSKIMNVIPHQTTEEENLEINREVMEFIARESGGRSYTFNNFFVNEVTPLVTKRIRPAVIRQINLSAQVWMLFSVLLLLIIEWIIRRYYLHGA